jgi:hypothetical protein
MTEVSDRGKHTSLLNKIVNYVGKIFTELATKGNGRDRNKMILFEEKEALKVNFIKMFL